MHSDTVSLTSSNLAFFVTSGLVCHITRNINCAISQLNIIFIMCINNSFCVYKVIKLFLQVSVRSSIKLLYDYQWCETNVIFLSFSYQAISISFNIVNGLKLQLISF